MSMRISSALLPALALGACGGPPSANGSDDVAVAQPDTAAPYAAERIACATGSAAFARDCTIERSPLESGTLLTIRQPDGGFRRLLVRSDGAVAAADGAVPASVRPVEDGGLIVTVGESRYRLPARDVAPAGG